MSGRSPQGLLEDLVLSGRTLDRAETLRGDESAREAAWRDPRAVVMVLSGEHTDAVAGPEGRVALSLTSTTALSPAASPTAMFLGFDPDRRPIFAIDDDTRPRLAEGRSLRDVGAALSACDAEIFTTALALAQWHRSHPRCSRCGVATVMEKGGWLRRCPADDSEHFPRTDPAVIMLIRDPQDRALLGRRAVWPAGWYSTLAGFVEPGESAESAVVREVAEEAGVDVDGATVQFLGSQPWPFPSSLMLGFHGYAVSQADPVPDGEEMSEVRWFSRSELHEACATGTVRIPPALSIARRLIERWYGEPLPGQWSRS